MNDTRYPFFVLMLNYGGKSWAKTWDVVEAFQCKAKTRKEVEIWLVGFMAPRYVEALLEQLEAGSVVYDPEAHLAFVPLASTWVEMDFSSI